MVLADRLLEYEPGIGFAQGADALGAGLITSSLMLGVYTIVGEAADNGWTSSRTLVCGGGCCCLLALLRVRQRILDRSYRCACSSRATCPARMSRY